MIECTASSKYLELDLSFTGASKKLLEEVSDEQTKNFLTKAEFWEKDLNNWIQYIRNDDLLLCPQLVRFTPLVTMGLQFTDDSTIAALNSVWRSKEETTDVLSFAVYDEQISLPGSQVVELGDIVVSVNRAEQQAKQHDHSLLHELRWLVSHGLLHLLGWDHPSSEKLNEMLSCQEQLLCFDGNLKNTGNKKRGD